MSKRPRSEDLELLLIDGDNLLHDVRGTRDDGGEAWLLPRLRAWRPDGLRIIVGLDGHPPIGEGRRARATHGIEFHHSGSRSADDMLIELLEGQPFSRRARTAVVTLDSGLSARARRAGGEVHSVDWLMGRLSGADKAGRAGVKPVGIGQGKRPHRHHPDARGTYDDARGGWQPGRGATKKKGNPKRSAKGSRRR